MTDTSKSKGPPAWKRASKRAWAIVGAVGVVLGILGYSVRDLPLFDDGSPGSSIPLAVGGMSAQKCGVEPGLQGGVSGAGWGPARSFYTLNKSALVATLDSITDNSVFGDEREFLEVKDNADSTAGGWCTTYQVHDGEVLFMRVFVENSAANTLAGPHLDGAVVARGVHLRLQLDGASDGAQASSLRLVTAFLTADNTVPKEIYSTLALSADHPFTLDPLTGAGRLYSNAYPEVGTALPDGVWSGQGTLLGYHSLDGVIVPGYRYSLYATVQVRVNRLGFGAASLLEEDGRHAEALPARGSGEGRSSRS